MPRFRRILPFLLMFLLLLPGAARAEEAILLFSSAAEVHADSSLLVREDITVRVEGREIRRGIFRDFPTRYRTPSGKTVRVGFSVEEALLNGKSIPWKTESRSNGVRVYLGDANSNAPRGEQTYTLVYTTTGQLGFFEQHDELYWNVTGNDWAFPIEKARFSMSLPGGASFSTVDIYTGFQGDRGKDAQLLPDGSVESTRRFAPGEGLTVAYTWPKGIVTEPRPSLVRTFFLLYGPWFLALSPVLLLVYYVLAWLRWGKDPPRKPVIPLFSAPEGHSPGFLRYVRRMGIDNGCFTAEVLDLAVNGFLVIEETTLEKSLERRGKIGEKGIMRGMVSVASRLAGKRYSLKLRRDQLSRKPSTRLQGTVLSALFPRGTDELLLSQENHDILGKAKSSLEKLYSREAKTLFSRNTLIWSAGILIPLLIHLVLGFGGEVDLAAASGGATAAFLVAGGIFLAAWKTLRSRGSLVKKVISVAIGLFIALSISAVFLVVLGGGGPLLLLPPVAVAVFVYFFRDLMTIRSPEGNDVLNEAEGLAMYMGTAERHRLEMFHPPEETPEVFEKLLPYAFALDTAETWANRFEDILKQNAYQPDWYTGANMAAFYSGGGVSSLASSVSDSIASASRAPGSSSGSGGGGSSGGGGGGGGGGGW